MNIKKELQRRENLREKSALLYAEYSRLQTEIEKIEDVIFGIWDLCANWDDNLTCLGCLDFQNVQDYTEGSETIAISYTWIDEDTYEQRGTYEIPLSYFDLSSNQIKALIQEKSAEQARQEAEKEAQKQEKTEREQLQFLLAKYPEVQIKDLLAKYLAKYPEGSSK